MDFRQLWSLFRLGLGNLRCIRPTLVATRKTVAICDELYGKKHHKNGPENAFRHALWNVLVARRCMARGLSLRRSLAWTKTITDWHEDFSPNKPLARAMDLHNNQVGRDLITRFPDEQEDFLIGQLLKMVPLSRKRASSDTTAFPEGLVHIESGHGLPFSIVPSSEISAAGLTALVTRNAIFWKRFFPETVEKNSSLPKAKDFLQEVRKLQDHQKQYLWGLKSCDDGQLMGLIYLKAIDWAQKEGELAYAIDTALAGKGWMTLAIPQVIKKAWDKSLERLHIITHTSNPASIAVARKNDFVWHRTLHAAFTPPDEEPLDMELYVLLKKSNS